MINGTHYEYLTGAAGTGKTFTIQRRIEEDEDYGILASTTGISAVNLGTVTINAVLGYFDTESLEDAFFQGRLTRRLNSLLHRGYRNLVIDEISMMDARQLDIIHEAVNDVNSQATNKAAGKTLGIVITGDFAQLPPVKAEWAFKAQCWPDFQENIVRLTKVWRQGEGQFLDAINAARQGNGEKTSELLKDIIDWRILVDQNFDGTTIVGTNKQVDRFNWLALNKLPGEALTVDSQRWGKPRSEWKHIPEELELKVGALVMLLSNQTVDNEIIYANGDQGHVVDVEVPDIGSRLDGVIRVELERNKEVVEINSIYRANTKREPPYADAPLRQAHEVGPGEPYYDPVKHRWHYGGIRYFPIRLAYAATVHKTQGLSLDRVQIDVRNQFLASPNMAYVALSRCRTAEGLTIVGQPDTLAKRVNVHPEVMEWL